MTKAIEQSVLFPASARALYSMYMNPTLHAAFTGAPVTIGPKPGSKFTAFDRMLSGTMLLALPPQLIVQRWRGYHWHKTDLDSVLILRFTQVGKQGRIDLTHVN